MQIVICEDNKSEQKHLESKIKVWAGKKKINQNILCFDNAEAFLFSWPMDIVVDVIFIDIILKEMSGIDLAEKIKETDKNVLIIFITNHDQFSLTGYDVDALHFLVKPVLLSKLFSVLDRAYDIWHSHEMDVIIIKNDDRLEKLSCRDIHFIKMSSHTAELYTATKTYKIRKTTSELTKQLPAHFKRCHRTYIVNLFKVDCIFEKKLLLSSGKDIPVSRKNAKHIKDAFVRLNKG